MVSEKELLVAAYLRQNARLKLTDLARLTGIPVSTLFDRMHALNTLGINRLSALVDFTKLGYNICVTLLLKVLQEKRDKLRDYLLRAPSVNSLFRINNGYDFMTECVFKDLKEFEEFCEKLERSYCVKHQEAHFVVEELKRENFLTHFVIAPVGGEQNE